jgi:hypothetical protein
VRLWVQQCGKKGAKRNYPVSNNLTVWDNNDTALVIDFRLIIDISINMDFSISH